MPGSRYSELVEVIREKRRKKENPGYRIIHHVSKSLYCYYHLDRLLPYSLYHAFSCKRPRRIRKDASHTRTISAGLGIYSEIHAEERQLSGLNVVGTVAGTLFSKGKFAECLQLEKLWHEIILQFSMPITVMCPYEKPIDDLNRAPLISCHSGGLHQIQ